MESLLQNRLRIFLSTAGTFLTWLNRNREFRSEMVAISTQPRTRWWVSQWEDAAGGPPPLAGQFCCGRGGLGFGLGAAELVDQALDRRPRILEALAGADRRRG